MSDIEEDTPAAAAAAAAGGGGGATGSGNGNDEAVATIAAVTGADAETAAHLLDAAGGDVNAAVGLFLEGGGAAMARAGGLAGGGAPPAATAAAAPRGGGEDDAIVLSDDNNDAGGGAAAAAARRARARAGGRPFAAVIDEDDDYLDGEGYVDVSDDDDEEGGAAGRQQQQQGRATRAATRAAAASPSTSRPPAPPPPAPLPFDLPDGINAEEARMLEAAMLGVPYEGPMPDFSAEGLAAAAAARDAARAAAEANLSPGAVAARVLRREQDDAYEQSLAEDRRKTAEAEAAARREREEAARVAAEKEAAEMEERERAEAADKAAVDAKARLPSEPEDSSPDLVQVAVRCPGGERLSRKFRKGEPVSLLFDFVDSERPSGVVLKSSTSNSSSPFSRSYRLLTSFPRKAIDSEDAALTFEGAGLCSRAEAVMLELPAE